MVNNARYTTIMHTYSYTVTTTDIKANMSHIPTSIVFRHLHTRRYNKILLTPPPHIRSSDEPLPHLTRRSHAQLRINNYNTKSTPTHIHHHYVLFVTHIISSSAHTYAPRGHPWNYGEKNTGVILLLQLESEMVG